MSLVTILEAIQRHWIYLAALVFFAWYPILTSLMWIFTSVVYFYRRERVEDESFYQIDHFPPVYRSWCPPSTRQSTSDQFGRDAGDRLSRLRGLGHR